MTDQPNPVQPNTNDAASLAARWGVAAQQGEPVLSEKGTGQDSDTLRSFGGFLGSTLGGGLIYLVLAPMGCTPPALGQTAPIVCPDGQQTDFLGSTVFGLVGQVDSTGAGVAGFLAMVACYLVASQMRS